MLYISTSEVQFGYNKVPPQIGCGGETREVKGSSFLGEERWESLTGEALTESSPKRLPIELLGGLPGFADWVGVECGPGGGKKKRRSKQSHLRSPPPQPGPRPHRRQSTHSSPPKPAPTVVGPNCVSSPRTSSKSNRSSPAKCCSCSNGGARGATAATGAAALAISVERLGPVEKSRHSRSRSRTAGTASLPGVTDPGVTDPG